MDTRSSPPARLPVGDGKGAIRALKARAVVVDMEDGVTNELLSGPMRDVFDTKQFITGQDSVRADPATTGRAARVTMARCTVIS